LQLDAAAGYAKRVPLDFAPKSGVSLLSPFGCVTPPNEADPAFAQKLLKI
jgi:hypothetical protein